LPFGDQKVRARKPNALTAHLENSLMDC